MITNVPSLTQGVSPFILWPALAVSSTILYLLLKVLYNLTLHPLRAYRGPRLWAASRLPYAAMLIRGDPHKKILALHRRYGPVVRVAPSELSFQSPDAWRDIMGHRKGGGSRSEENVKRLVVGDGEKHADIITANREDHARYRRILSHGFSAKSMQEQQPVVKSYVDLLVDRLHAAVGGGRGAEPVDVVSWYNYATFDIIGDLAFGESFGCLAGSDYHPWVRLIFDEIKTSLYFHVARFFPVLAPLLVALIPRSLVEKRKAHKQLVRERVDSRIALGTSRPDFAEAMLKKTGAESLTREELYENSNILIIAGSETTATALSGATYLLTSNRDKLARLTEEVRGAFASPEEIDILGTARLPYLQAVIEETLRCYPPVPSALPRVTPPAGQDICGHWIPGNTTMGIWHWPMYHSEKHFSRPFEFLPERWMGDPAFENDRRDVLKPFHFGPRNCLGMNLAYAEMRTILSRMVWHFDMELSAESAGWIDQQVYTIWSKPPLKVHLTPRRDV